MYLKFFHYSMTSHFVVLIGMKLFVSFDTTTLIIMQRHYHVLQSDMS